MRISDWSSDVCSSDLAARGTGKQRHAEFFFQFLDGPRQRRLFNMQLLRCASEAEFFGHSQKVSKVTKLHSDSYPVSRREAESIFSLDAIGRVSCRERACKYVSIRVWPVLLKK